MKARPLIFTLAFCCLSSYIPTTDASASTPQRTRRRTSVAQPAATPAPSPDTTPPVATEVNSAMTLRWRGQPGVTRYRLQVARDEAFTDIVVDRAVNGLQASVEVPTGRYYWRVAPAAELEAGTYSQPQVAEANAVGAGVAPNLILASTDTGWRTATGEVSRPVSAALRAGQGFDIVAVSSDGFVRAVEGATGMPLWTAPFAPGARRGEEAGARASNFMPLVVAQAGGGSNIVVAYNGGLRALRGDTGRELWRATLEGQPTGGVAADVDGDGKPEVVASVESPNSLVVLSGDTGRVVSNTKLDAAVVGMPAAFQSGAERGVLTGHADGTVTLRRATGEQVRSTKLETRVTTQPVVITTARGDFVVVGSERGLAALKADDLQLMGIIYTENDSPRGHLTVSDTDGDGTSEIAFVTREGRVALVGTVDGKVKWTAEGAADAGSVALADLNGDGVQDVLVAGGNIFAYGFSGRDGTLIWKAEELTPSPTAQAGGPTSPRSLVVAPLGPNGALVVGADPMRVNLRAFELPKGAVKSAAR
ncbi:MAG TPA: PQQ-binding-like beta-propeller repeat protein [Pyrinomonadaceae bacterium]|nr:PQQ-binding-like beta-propeller repeat protein [Pyrinomonadaceae bacterium]